jgi:Flp pilus assembly protein TadB
MGETPADTEREISRLRGDLTAALDELERRVRGGVRTVAAAEARIASGRATDDLVGRARRSPALLGVLATVGVGAVAYSAYALISGQRERQKPTSRLRRGVEQARERLTERAERAERAARGLLPEGVLLKLEPERGGYVRVSDARLEPSHKKRGQSTVIKKLIWAGLLSVFMALGSVVARRVADNVWRAMVHEDPPTEKSKASS